MSYIVLLHCYILYCSCVQAVTHCVSNCLTWCSIGSPQRRSIDPLVVSLSVAGVVVVVTLLAVLTAAVIWAKMRRQKRARQGDVRMDTLWNNSWLDSTLSIMLTYVSGLGHSLAWLELLWNTKHSMTVIVHPALMYSCIYVLYIHDLYSVKLKLIIIYLYINVSRGRLSLGWL